MQITKYYAQEIANAIITQAVNDYRRALAGKGYDKKSPESVIDDVERFFRSKYFRVLTKVSGVYLIEKLRKEHEENVRKEQVCESN